MGKHSVYPEPHPTPTKADIGKWFFMQYMGRLKFIVIHHDPLRDQLFVGQESDGGGLLKHARGNPLVVYAGEAKFFGPVELPKL